MRKLEVLSDDPLSLYDAIVASKDEPRRSRLHAARDRIACAYSRYRAHSPRLERQRPLGRRISAEEGDDLRYCYASSRAQTSAVYDRMYAKILARSYFCAYCGIIPSATLDHYLPKDGKRGYPELAILPANLIPSCHSCNTPRGFRDPAGQRALIHPYFDSIRQEQLLFADVHVRDGVPEAKFRVEVGGCSDQEFGELFGRHVRLLSLLQRYREHAGQPDQLLSDVERTVRKWGGGKSPAEIVVLLLEDAEEDERRLGANHFKTVLTRGAAASQAFLDFCRRSSS